MNEAQTLTLEAGKYYRTRNGKRAHIVYIMANSPFNSAKPMYPASGWLEGKTFPHCWNLDGSLHDPDNKSDEDLVAEWVEPKRIKGWIAVQSQKEKCVGSDFIGDEVAFTSHVLATREEAEQRYAGRSSAIIEIDVLEGHGLNGEAA